MFFPHDDALRRDLPLRYDKIRYQMATANVSALLLTASSNLFYCSGRVFLGYVYIPLEGEPLFFPMGKVFEAEESVIPIRKPEQIPDYLLQRGQPLPTSIGLETGETSPAEYFRLQKLFPDAGTEDATAVMRNARSLKTAYEIEELRRTGREHASLYLKIPSLYELGMTDLELAAAVEYHCRKLGHIGYFRTFGFRMEGYMGVVLAGKNGRTPAPYDFSLGGAGLSPAYPIGCCNAVIERGDTILVDINYNPRGYMTDISRSFALVEVDEETRRIHDVARAIESRTSAMLKPGTLCSDLHKEVLAMAADAGLSHIFMGEQKQAAFLGHGLGIDINELPVLTERNEVPLAEGMVIAIEPKFVTPHGPVGVEDTYLVTAAGGENITACPDDLRVIG